MPECDTARGLSGVRIRGSLRLGVHLPGVVRAPVGALDRYRRPLSVTALS